MFDKGVVEGFEGSGRATLVGGLSTVGVFEWH